MYTLMNNVCVCLCVCQWGGCQKSVFFVLLHHCSLFPLKWSFIPEPGTHVFSDQKPANPGSPVSMVLDITVAVKQLKKQHRQLQWQPIQPSNPNTLLFGRSTRIQLFKSLFPFYSPLKYPTLVENLICGYLHT